MGYRSGAYTKIDYARTAAATIAYFLSLQRDAVGLLHLRGSDHGLPAPAAPARPPPPPDGGARARAEGPRDRPGRAARADRRDRPQARADHPDLRPARPDRHAPHQARLPAVPRPRGRRAADPRPGGGRVPVHDAGDVPRPGIGPRAVHRPGVGPRGLPAAVRRARRRRSSGRASDLGIEYDPITTDRPLELVLFDLLKARMRQMRRPDRKAAAGRGAAR